MKPGPGLYGAVFALLLLLTALTVGLSRIDLGPWNLAAALGVAALKASAVALVFMHVRWSPRLVWLAAGGGLFWLLVLLLGTMADLAARAS